MAAEHQYFYEDEVYRINKKGNIEFGMVLENSELVSSDENSDEEGGRMKKGHIRVAWHPTGEEEVLPERKVHLADRSLMPGDVVRRMIKGRDTQRGYCRDIKVTASVQVVGTKQVIPNVKSEELVPLEEYATDIAACLDSWVGGIKTVHSKLQIKCPDGSRCVINDIEAAGFEDFHEKRDCECEFPGRREDFYPGQTLSGPLHCLEGAEWLHCSKELKALRSRPNIPVQVVVEEVRTESVGVHWQCRAYSKEGAGTDKEQPKFLVQGEDLKRLKLLNVFEPCTLQVGDRNFYIFKECDIVMTKEHWRKSQTELFISRMLNGPNIHKFSPKKIKNKDTEKTKEFNGVAEDKKSRPATPIPELKISSVCDEPVPNDVENNEDWESEDTGSVSDTASVSSGCSSIGSLGKKKRGPALMTKVLKKKKLRRTRKKAPNVVLQPGNKIVVETLSTSSIADVVWQDGSVEQGIPSVELYPIHHLDDQEFFPGDFVIENKEDSCMRVYGVIQSVDHAGRTATVKWFKTYTSLEEPRPAFLEQNEVSVYDLKDHPDFQYRPGTVVIRVANFEGEDVNCTAGQVLDNYPEGKVRVWWVDGHVSMSWPQDLYKVGEYDSDEGELWDDNSSEASWETESEDCIIADEGCPEEDLQELKPKLAANIEKARIAMSRLEEIFTQNPALQTTSVMRQLLDVYKDCRYLDRLMGTSFFHENHFQGLLERVRERGRANVAQRVADQVNRLFQKLDDDDSGEVNEAIRKSTLNSPSDANDSVEVSLNNWKLESEVKYANAKDSCEDCVFEDSKSQNLLTRDSGVSSSSSTCKDSSGSSGNESLTSGEFLISENLVNLERHVVTAANNSKNSEESSISVDNRPRDIKEYNSSKPTVRTNCKQFTQGEDKNIIPKFSNSRTDLKCKVGTTDELSEGSKANESDKNQSVSNVHVCVKLCSLIKAQLVKAHAEVTRRFGGNQGMMALCDELSGSATTKSSSAKEESTIISCEDTNATNKEKEVQPQNTIVNGKVSITNHVTSDVISMDKVSSCSPPKLELTSQVLAEDSAEIIEEDDLEAFSIMDSAPNSHKFKLTMFQPTEQQNFFRTVRNELKLLRSSLPDGIWVKGFEDRMDLYSVMIRGPEKTPYEDGLFFFDFQLSADYPKAPPLCHYISYCSDRLNPNLYEDGKVCISLLGTWSGKGTEVWTLNSNLLQVIVSIQGLILVSEPYFNEAGYEKQKGSQQGKENSRMYNEMAVLKLVQAMTKLLLQPPQVFKEEILQHFRKNAHKLLHRLNTWLEISEWYNNSHPVSPTTPTSFRELHGQDISSAVNVQLPEFPLIPASKGFCLTLRKTLITYREVLTSVGVLDKLSSS